MLRCTLIDDDRIFLDEFKIKLQLIFDSSKVDAEFHLFYHVEELEDTEKADVYFIDVEMPKKSGFEVARQIKARNKQALIIFISSNDYAEDAYDIHPFDFINKNKLEKVLERKMNSLLDEIRDPFYKCKTNAVTLEIDVNSIIYVMSVKHYIYLNTIQKNQIMEVKERRKLSDCYVECNSIKDIFVQTSKSEMINMDYIEDLKEDEFFLPILKRTIHISKKYLIQARKRFYNHKMR